MRSRCCVCRDGGRGEMLLLSGVGPHRQSRMAEVAWGCGQSGQGRAQQVSGRPGQKARLFHAMSLCLGEVTSPARWCFFSRPLPPHPFSSSLMLLHCSPGRDGRGEYRSVPGQLSHPAGKISKGPGGRCPARHLMFLCRVPVSLT